MDKPYAPPEEEYLPFQMAGITELTIRRHVLLADEMGLGKTIQVLGYINLTKPEKVLVVCPNSLRLNWLREIDKWLEPALRARYDIEFCTPSFYIPSNFVIASYEGLTKWNGALATPWDLVVLDEGHFIKNRTAQRTRAAQRIRDVASKRIILTGTPIPNYPYELEPLVNWLDPEQWPVHSLDRYCRAGRYGVFGYNLRELQQYLREGKPQRVLRTGRRRVVERAPANSTTTYECAGCNVGLEYENDAARHTEQTGHEVRIIRKQTERLISLEREEQIWVDEPRAGVMIRRLKKEVLKDLPKKRRQIIELPAEGELLDLVNEERALIEKEVEVKRMLDAIFEVGGPPQHDSDDHFSAALESLKSTKGYFFSEMSRIRHELAVAKVPYVIEHVDNVLENKDKLVIFIHHNDVGEALLEHYRDKAVLVYGPTSVTDRDLAVQRFTNDEKCQVFIGSLKVSGLGLNLQVASHIVFAEIDWVPGVLTQAEDRCHRIGQEHPLLIQHLVAEDSLDSYMAQKIVAKQRTIQKALDRGREV